MKLVGLTYQSGPTFIIKPAMMMIAGRPLPIVCPEREQGQQHVVFQVACLEILEAITHGNGSFYLGRRDEYRLVARVIARHPEVCRLGLVEHAVFARDLKALDTVEAGDAVVIVLKAHIACVALYSHALVAHALTVEPCKAIVSA